MAAGLHRTEPGFRKPFDQVAEIARRTEGLDLYGALFGPDPASAASLEQPSLALPALFAVEYALAQLWLERGLRPTALIGHSLGEYTAACVAGVFSVADAVGLVALRGRLFEEIPPGAMASVALGPEALAATLGDLEGQELSVAAVNRTDSTVIAGPTAAVDEAERRLAELGVDQQRLHISVAAHSHLVDPILDRFGEHLAGLPMAPPSIPFVSNLTGAWARADEVTTADYWTRHLRHTVRLVDGLGVVLGRGPGALIEVGPGQALTGYALSHPGHGDGHEIVPSLPHPADPTADDAYFLNSVGRLWRRGLRIDLGSLSSGEERRRIPLPTYPFARTRHWVEPAAPSANPSPPPGPP
ncbi:MAG: acyltransferase domain-containing protein, partial [Actinomycetota bacterium]